MASIIDFGCSSLGFSSFLASLSLSLNSSQRAIPLSQRLHGRMVSGYVASSVGSDFSRTQKPLSSFKIQATVTETEQPKWWERCASPNMVDVHSVDEFLAALSQAGDRLVIAEFYGTWCASCRAIFPKLCRTATDHPDILFLKINFDENKPMCKTLNVKVLPNFHFYRGANGQLEAFSCSLAKFQKIKDAIELHNTDRCSIGPPKGVEDLDRERLLVLAEKLPKSS